MFLSAIYTHGDKACESLIIEEKRNKGVIFRKSCALAEPEESSQMGAGALMPHWHQRVAVSS